MDNLEKGKYLLHRARSVADLDRVMDLRARCFDVENARDRDALDDACTHVMIVDRRARKLVCCFRLMDLTGARVSTGYAARFYDLAALEEYDGNLLELGRFCVDPACRDPEILRLAWAALTAYVDRRDIRLLIGCSSFGGVDPTPYQEAFAWIRARHVAPTRWAPRSRAAETIGFAAQASGKPCGRQAMRQMPPLLRSYLRMGAWVSDHAVIDRGLGTLHVFTGLEIDAIPPGRKALLRAI